jgi:hypothetical protein
LCLQAGNSNSPPPGDRKRKFQFTTPVKAKDTTHAWVHGNGTCTMFFLMLVDGDVPRKDEMIRTLNNVCICGPAKETNKSAEAHDPAKCTIQCYVGSNLMIGKMMTAAKSVVDNIPIKAEHLAHFKQPPRLFAKPKDSEMIVTGQIFMFQGFLIDRFDAMTLEPNTKYSIPSDPDCSLNDIKDGLSAMCTEWGWTFCYSSE